MLIVALVVVALFAVGTAIAIVVDRAKADRTASNAELPAGHPAGSTGTGGQGGPGSSAATKTATASTATPDASGGLSDAEAIKQAPKTDDATPAKDAASYLDAGFGAAILPTRGTGLVMRGSATLSADTVRATYSGDASSGVDMIQVIVKRAADSKSAKTAAEALATDYPVGFLQFMFGSRAITQMTTAEDRPDIYPPAISLTWLQGRYAIQVAVIPANSSSVGKARDTALTLIGDLPF